MEQPARKRTEILDRMRSLKMARSTHAYVRGNTLKFYEWLADSRSAARLPVGPPVWICGDCHLGNLGPIADIDGKVEVQIRDLDQTVIGNPAHDLIRLGLSLATAARGSDLPGVTTARMIEEMVQGYDHALALGEEDATPEPNVVRSVRRRALGRRWRHLAQERLDGAEPRLPMGKRFWALEEFERAEIDDLFAQDLVRSAILAFGGRADEDRVRLIDVAYWMKGCSSLGKLRFAALVGLGGSKKEADAYALIDLKEAVTAAAPAAAGVAMPADDGERVVAGAKALSPNLGERMLATRLLGKPVVLRELMPQDLKLEIEQFSRSEATKAARYLAYVVGVAHARQLAPDDRRAWRRALAARTRSEIEAPSWLWDSVVDLTATHEAGYLEHCRLHALADVA